MVDDVLHNVLPTEGLRYHPGKTWRGFQTNQPAQNSPARCCQLQRRNNRVWPFEKQIAVVWDSKVRAGGTTVCLSDVAVNMIWFVLGFCVEALRHWSVLHIPATVGTMRQPSWFLASFTLPYWHVLFFLSLYSCWPAPHICLFSIT